MSKIIDLAGRRFGRLVVDSRLPNHKTSGGNLSSVWLCVCDCGNHTNVLSNSLLRGKTKSCGCLATETSAINGKHNRKHGGYSKESSYEDSVKYQALVNIRERAKHRGYESDLDIEDLPSVGDCCPVLGLRYNKGSLKDKNSSPSVDRKNTNLPYLKKYKDNLVFISHRANRIKSDATPDEIRKVLEYVETQGQSNASTSQS